MSCNNMLLVAQVPDVNIMKFEIHHYMFFKLRLQLSLSQQRIKFPKKSKKFIVIN